MTITSVDVSFDGETYTLVVHFSSPVNGAGNASNWGILGQTESDPDDTIVWEISSISATDGTLTLTSFTADSFTDPVYLGYFPWPQLDGTTWDSGSVPIGTTFRLTLPS